MILFRKFSSRIIFSYAVLVGVLMAVLFGFFNSLNYASHLDIIKQEMDEKIRFIELVFRGQKAEYPAGRDMIIREMRSLSDIIGLRITLVDFTGNVIADTEIADAQSMDNHLHREEITGASLHGTGFSIRYSSSIGTDTLYYAKKSGSFYIRLAKPLHDIDESLSGFRRKMLLFIFPSAIAGIFFVYVISRRMTRPIREAQSFAEQFAEGNFDKRILNYRDDEIGSVQRGLNKLADSVVDKMKKLNAERKKLETTFETIPDGIAVICSDRTVEFANSAFISMICPGAAAAGRRSYEAIRSRKINEKIDESVVSAKPLSFEEEFSDGRCLEIHISHLRENGNPVSLLLVLHDVTERKRIERIKSDLVGNMSHELKTPVTIMKGYLETIKTHLDDKELSALMIARAIENADRQNSLINDILKLHMIETSAGMEKEMISLPEIAENCVRLLSSKAADRSVKLEMTSVPELPSLKGSRFLAEEILFNIIDNGINYNNPGGKVTVSFSAQNGKTVCLIRDTGIGIPPESIDRIFERFYRVDKSRSRATGGTGLGLSIVRHAADLMGWMVTVSSGEGGTEFRINA
ncbi:MAG: ATP-binding protein [Spirochaetota bacterium]